MPVASVPAGARERVLVKVPVQTPLSVTKGPVKMLGAGVRTS